MPHLPRIHAPGLYYHVFARGNNKDPIFFEKANYQRFLNTIEKNRLPLHFKLYAYSLLPNHFHLMVQVQSVPLAKIMQILMTAYTMYANKKYHRVGHIFQGRYQSIIVEKETYLLQVNRYIHINAVKAGLARLPEEYPWSSYNNYLHEDITDTPHVETNEILELFSTDSLKQQKLFREFTLSGISNEFDPLKEHIRGVLGGPKLTKKLIKILGGSHP
jgi:putative transposase